MRRAATGFGSKVPVLAAVVLVLGAGGLFYARSRSDTPSRAAVAERQESCDRLLAFSSIVFDPALSPPAPAEPVLSEASRGALVKMGADIDQLVESSEGKIRTDVRTLAGALRAQPADPAALRTPAFSEARRNLQSYLNDPENKCQPAGGSGEG